MFLTAASSFLVHGWEVSDFDSPYTTVACALSYLPGERSARGDTTSSWFATFCYNKGMRSSLNCHESISCHGQSLCAFPQV